MPSIALYLPYLTETVYWRPYLEKAGEEQILDWIFDRLHSIYPTIVVTHGGPESVMLHQPERAAWNVVECESRSKLAALNKAVAMMPEAGPLVSCSPEAAFIPAWVFEAAVAEHAKAGSQYTFVTGAPRGVLIEVFEPELLSRLDALELPQKPGNPAELIQRVSIEALFTNGLPAVRAKTWNCAIENAPDVLTLRSIFDCGTAVRVIPECRRNELARENPAAVWKEAANAPFPAPSVPALARSDHRLRVLFFSRHAAFTGAEEALQSTIRAMSKEGIEPLAFVPMPGMFAEKMADAGCRVFHCPADFGTAGPQEIRFLDNLLDELQPDVIHLNAHAGSAILNAGRERGIPLVQHLRVSDPAGFEETIRECHTIIAVSDFVRCRFAAAFPAAAEKIGVVYDGVDTTRFSAATEAGRNMRRDLQFEPQDFVVLVAARIVKQKRHDLLLAALKFLRSEARAVQALLVGDDSEQPDWSAAIHAESAALGCVRRLPFQNDMRGVYAAADLLVSCSEVESLGMAPLEAMAMGVPIVVPDQGGTRELIEPETSGLLFPAGDAAALASLIRRLRDDPALRDRMATAARRRVEREYSIRDCGGRLLSCLQRACRGRS